MIYLINWGSRKMAGFLEARLVASEIILPFLDTLPTRSIQPDKAA